MPQGAVRNCVWVCESPRCRRAKAALSWSPIRASFAADHWWSQPAARRFPKWDQAVSATRSRSNSVSKIVPPRAGAGAADIRCGVAGAIRRSVGRFGRCDRQLRQDAFRRGVAVHPSRAERPGHPADIVVLARGPRHRDRHGAADRCAGRAEAIAPRSSQAGNGDRAGDVLPKRLARKIADATAGPERIADFSDKLLAKVAADVKQWRVKPNGTEGYRTAEVTLGGVDTSGLSSKTFEAKSVPGFISSARSSMSPAISAASTFNGPGRRDTPPAGTFRALVCRM